MNIGLVGQKIGMTRVFLESGEVIPVTILHVPNNFISQIKTKEIDGYTSVQIAFGSKKSSKLCKALLGHLGKAGVGAHAGLKEFRVNHEEDLERLSVGDLVGISDFHVGQFVDVEGVSKGKGFSGAIKRHNFSSNRASHGNSRSHNAPGSIGQAQDPGRIFPGKKMAGQYGNKSCTVQNLEIVKLDTERQLIFVKGAVPGAKFSNIVLKSSVKVVQHGA